MSDSTADRPTRAEQEEQRIAEEVSLAFRDARPPARDELVAHPCHECQRVADAFAGVHWRDVPLEVITRFHDALPLLSSVAFQHYLPAYIQAILLHLDDVEPLIWDSIFHNLTPPEDSSDTGWFNERMNGFSLAQRAVLREYVKHYLAIEKHVDEDGRRRAVRYWGLER